jgi:23S rRNA (uridine2552-2'-O)-methyltransferase
MPEARRKHRSNPEWIARHVNDPFVKAATAAGYRSRAAYKLTEIDDRERLLRPGRVVVDLGAAPGSWSQVASERMGLAADRTGGPRATPTRLIALDVLPMDPLPGVEILTGDFREAPVLEALAALLDGRPVDVVLSDMAPNLSGIAAADAARTGHLCELALEFAVGHLASRGVLLVKAFQGSGYTQFVTALKRHFLSVAVRKPAASRAESAETYLLARDPRPRDGR